MPLSDVLSASGALLLVVGLVFLLNSVMRRLQARTSGGGGSRLSVTAQLGIDGKRRLQLVSCDDRQVLVLTGGASDVLLAWPPAPAGDRR